MNKNGIQYSSRDKQYEEREDEAAKRGIGRVVETPEETVR